MNESTLYSTFTTAPEPLAGGGAILVAVVLYRLGEIDQIIDKAADHLETAWQAYPFRELWRALERNGWKGVERVLHRLEAGAAGGAAEQAACRRAYRALRGGRQVPFPLYPARGFTGAAHPRCRPSLPRHPNPSKSAPVAPP